MVRGERGLLVLKGPHVGVFLSRAPAHFPEVGFEPGSFLKIAISSASRAGVA